MKRLGCLTLLLLLAAAGWAFYVVFKPYQGFSDNVFLEIPRGTGTQALAAQLRSAGVIQSEWPFLLVRAVRRGVTLQAGEYRFDKPASVWDVFGRLARGDIYYVEITVPEGSNIFDIAKLLSDAKLPAAEGFLEVAKRNTLIRDLAPDAPSLEGYLFPSTYRLTRKATADQFARQLTGAFRKTWESLGAKANVNEIVTLASLVEKETGVAAERPIVASVYRNRLEKGMRLQCDPTTIYAALLEGRYRGTIYKSDLENPHPYNTYQRAGLPPGPIANPGLASLRAAVQPARTEYLFFVAKPDGSGAHTFSTGLSDHARAVEEFRRGAAGR